MKLGKHTASIARLRKRETDQAKISDAREETLLQDELTSVHEQLEALFLKHQVTLVNQDLKKASAIFAEFRTQIEKHIEVEEEYLLPLYEARGGDEIVGGRTHFYVREHRKIERFIDEIEADLRRAVDGRSPGDPAEMIVELLEREHFLKDLLKHHDQRERSFLYPFLERSMTPAENKEILTLCLSGRK